MKRFFIFSILIAVFIAPGALAYLFYTHPQWLGKTTVNKGHFLQPTIHLPFLQDLTQNDSVNSLKSEVSNLKDHGISFQPQVANKWHLILWYPGECGSLCKEKINQLARIRLALGRRLYNVNQSLILKEGLPPLSESVKAIFQEDAIQVLYLPAISQQLKAWNNQPQIFIANPSHYAILSYSLETKPKDLFQDLNQLLSINHV